MHLLSNRVAGSMRKLLAESLRGDVAAGDIVGRAPGYRPPGRDLRVDERDGLVARVSDNLEHVDDLGRRLRAEKAGPSDVVIDGSGPIQFRPYVQQHEITRTDG